MNKKMQILLIIILIAVVVVLSFFIFSRKCVEYIDPQTGNHSGGCFHILQRGYWSGGGLFKDQKNDLWNNLDETTYKKNNNFAGEGYVFYEDENGQNKCIRQVYGSGAYVVASEFIEVNIINESTIELNGEIFKYKADKLVSSTSVLTLYNNKPLIYNKNGLVDMEIFKKSDFGIKELD